MRGQIRKSIAIDVIVAIAEQDLKEGRYDRHPRLGQTRSYVHSGNSFSYWNMDTQALKGNINKRDEELKGFDMLNVISTETTHFITGHELRWRRLAVLPKLSQAELALKLNVLTRQTMTQQKIFKLEQSVKFGVNDEMLAAMNEVLG